MTLRVIGKHSGSESYFVVYLLQTDKTYSSLTIAMKIKKSFHTEKQNQVSKKPCYHRTR